MKRTIPSIPQLYRNVRRWTEILSVLSKYGLADWLSRVKIDFVKDGLKAPDGKALARLTQAARIRLAITELGPTFIKLGQLMSTRPDVVGVEVADELTKLQANVPADPFEHVKSLIEQEQQKPLNELFVTFEETPIASASIGQVHRATLQDGREVVVKVQHEGIEGTIERDLDILMGLAHLAEKLDDFKPYQPRAMVGEMSRTLRRELDFMREQRNLIQFSATLAGRRDVRIPQPISRLCSSKMLTMERLDGIKLNDADALARSSADLAALARRGADLYLKMIFEDGFYHADPHPGNLLVVEDGVIGLLDFGMVGRVSDQLREDIEAMLVAIVNRDVPLLVTLIQRVGSSPLDLDEAAFSNDVADFVGQYATQQLSHFDMSGALKDFVSIVRQYRFTLPSEVTMLIKVLVTLEGTGRLLNPRFSLMEVMQPFHRTLILRRLSPARQMRKIRRFYLQVEQLADSVPKTISNILEQVQSGKFDVHLDHRRLGPTVNRLVLGMMTSALFLGSAWILGNQVPPLLLPGEGFAGIRDLSILGLTGCVIAFVMGFRLILAIRKSGNLDRDE